MPSKSKAQQRFMGLVHAYNKGDVKGSEVSKKVKDAANSMKKSDVKKYASTTHKGKPEKVKKEAIDKIKEMIRMELESCGYTMSAKDPSYKLKSPGGTGEEDRRLKKENVLNEMNYKGFIKYMNDFYGPKGVYPDKKKRTLKPKDINMAYSILLKKKPNFEIGFDSTDREMIRDILIKQRKLDPDYNKGQLTKDSVNESKKEKDQIIKYLQGLGFNKRTAKNAVAKSYNYISKAYRNTGTRYKGDLIARILNKKESVNEGKGVEKIMKMADDHSFGKLGGRTVDAMTANLFKQVYDKAPQNAKDKIDKMNEKQLYIFMGKLWSKFGKQVRLR